MIDYEKIQYCLREIIIEGKNGINEKDVIESILHTANYALGLLKSQSEPKFKTDDEAWTCFHGEINQWVIENIFWDDEANDYRVNLIAGRGKGSFLEKDLYPTKAALIESQIKYWTCLRNEENSTHSIDMSIASAQEHCLVSGVKLDKACKHEPDGIEHAMVDDGGSFSMNRCKKCGEFYR